MHRSVTLSFRILGETIVAVVAALSLVICLAALICWPRSHWTADSFWWNSTSRIDALALSSGSVEIYRQDVPADAPFRVMANKGHRGGQHAEEKLSAVRKSGLATARTFLDFGYTAGDSGYGYKRVIVLPMWFIALIASLLPAIYIRRIRRYRADRRRLRGQCVRCGYDLRATPDRCPECGTIPNAV